jgi:hypothetical protein
MAQTHPSQKYDRLSGMHQRGNVFQLHPSEIVHPGINVTEDESPEAYEVSYGERAEAPVVIKVEPYEVKRE